MNRVLVTLLVGALLVGVVPAAATLTDVDDDSEPGAKFAGVVGVQRAEVGNEVAKRSLDHRLETARSERSKAAVVASETAQLSERLDELEQRKSRLKTALENDSISRGEYQARLAQLAAEIRSVERRANTTADAATNLPTETLDEKGVDAEKVRSVARRANEVGGGDVSEAASRVAGNGVGNGLGNVPPGQQRANESKNGGEDTNRGQPDNPGQGDGTNTQTDVDSKPSGPPSNPGQGEQPNECRSSQNCTDDQPPGNGKNGAGTGDTDAGESGSNGNENAADPDPGNDNGANDGERPGNGAGNGNGNGQGGPNDGTVTPTPTPTPTTTEATVDNGALSLE